VNVWLINHYAYPPTEPGDARHYSHARELLCRGYGARIIACNFHHLTHKYISMAAGRIWEHCVLEGVPFTWITARPYRANSVARIWNMLQFGRRAWKGDWAVGLPPPDLILGSSPHPFAALAAEQLASRHGVPFVLEIRDPWPLTFTEVGGYSKYHPFVQLVDRTMRYLYARAARIVMFSKDSADLLVRYGADPQRIVWIPNGVDLRSTLEPRPAPDDGQFTVTYLGAHNQWNSLDVVLDAAKLLQNAGVRDVLIRFVGDGASKPGLVERARTEGIRNVRFEDPVTKKQVPGILHTSDAFIINNRKDGASKGWMSFQKMYDYLAAGRPIVFGCCSNCDPVRESGAGISVEADNPAELARAIQYLSGRSREQLWEYGLLGHRYIEKAYNLPLLVDRFESLIADLTRQPLVAHKSSSLLKGRPFSYTR
jgi:glycosyltransferase involved in cell wall biosynthesis